ncbi:MAG: MBL fold metallo-hydrolase [Proteobacteria bacterium]|nr:MBL fold metallo-hydrolase [Pseudomonadota bacterium]
MPAIHTIRLGFTNTYLIEAEGGFVAVDAGSLRREKAFAWAMGRLGLAFDRVRLIVATHVHYDHVGSLSAIRNLCRCPAAVHRSEAPALASGRMAAVPAGTNPYGRFVSAVGTRVASRGWLDFPPVRADILVDGHYPLADFGLDGRLVLTRGHTAGSISLILNSGQAFIGDVAVNYLPFGLGPIMPPFADNTGRLFETWRELGEAGIRTLYPAHGLPFSIYELLAQRERRLGLVGLD